MHRAGGDVLAGADLLVPVPLHWTRLFQRRYNQAVLLAQAMRAAGGPEVAADWLVRRRRTPMQGHLGPAARERNVRGAFAMRGRRSVAGRRVVLVDDVMTTGATVDGVRPGAETRGSSLRRCFDPGTRAARRVVDLALRSGSLKVSLVMRMAEVEIYTTMFCPYCARARALLERKGVAYTEIDIIEEPARRDEMIRRAGGRTSVPQIFINGEHIGGSDELAALDRAGKLDAKLGSGEMSG